MNESNDVNECRMQLDLLAKELYLTRQLGGIVNPDSVARALTIESAYEVQYAILTLGCDEVIGFKIGATTESTMGLLGLRGPFYGPLLASHFRSSGCCVTIPLLQTVMVEAEIAVGLSKDLPPKSTSYTKEEVECAVGWVSPAIELCSCRFSTELAGNGPLLIADGGINMEFIQGTKCHNYGRLDLSSHPVVLSIGGKTAAAGDSGVSIAGHPFGMVAWLANQLMVHGRGLKTGDIVTTGSCTGLLPVKAGDKVSADFGLLGEVSVQFES